MQIGFVLFFAVLGCLISSTCGFLVGNRFTYISFVTLLSSIAFGGLGFGIYYVLESRVPEFLEFVSTFSLAGLGGGSEESGFEEGETSGFASEPSGIDDYGVASVAPPEMDPSLARAKSGKFGDHIVIDKIAIKNEPKLMAEAIRTMLAKDDPQE
ncbi:hypothetical protein LPTSP4_20380 [Leptospira ryugenii]|uniref:Uncharacterized protein n=1 Tax=Leptospira ryugenii TaxID=1917863 RepID=A0A2P2E0W3_9LEPT|nr:hypothetical protein [Leptospira ryugenii]GBF50512.1 hypothetical protein LPTSP4_20380 [Leptospira ryugenii]